MLVSLNGYGSGNKRCVSSVCTKTALNTIDQGRRRGGRLKVRQADAPPYATTRCVSSSFFSSLSHSSSIAAHCPALRWCLLKDAFSTSRSDAHSKHPLGMRRTIVSTVDVTNLA